MAKRTDTCTAKQRKRLCTRTHTDCAPATDDFRMKNMRQNEIENVLHRSQAISCKN